LGESGSVIGKSTSILVVVKQTLIEKCKVVDATSNDVFKFSLFYARIANDHNTWYF